jgi:hypothetical protein
VSVLGKGPGRRTALAVGALLLTLASACAPSERHAVRPVDAGRAPATTADAVALDAADPTSGPAPMPEPARAGATPSPAPTGDVPGGAGAADRVRAVLERYDRVVTALHADPAALLRPGDPLPAEWAAVVVPGTVLADDVTADVLGRLERGEWIPAEPGAVSYLHHLVEVLAAGPERVSFRWCGWSPGIVRDVRTGAVVDDAVGVSEGRGVVERTPDGWMLTSLDQTALDLRPAGSPDPCPSGPPEGDR